MNDRGLQRRLDLGAAALCGGERAGGFSAQEVSAAINTMADELGEFTRELFCYTFWPDYARYGNRDLERMVLRDVLEQCKVRALQAKTAQLAHDIAELELTLSRRRSVSSTSELATHRRTMESAKARRWPSPSPVYQRLTLAVLSELRDPESFSLHLENAMSSRKTFASSTARSSGGRRRRSDLARAHALRITWHAYTKTWKAPFEWTLDQCEVAIRSAIDTLHRNLTLGRALEDEGKACLSDLRTATRSGSDVSNAPRPQRRKQP